MLKKRCLKLREQGIAKEFLLAFLSSILLVWTVFIGTPFDIVVSNFKEFMYAPGSSILWNGVFYGACVLISLIVIYALLAFIFTKGMRKFLLFLLMTVALFVWANTVFLTGMYGEFDGRGNTYIATFGFLNWIQVGTFFAIFTLIFCLRNCNRVLLYIVGSVLFVSLATGTIKIVSKLSEQSLISNSEVSFFTYSKNNPNVLLIILDEYQSDFFEQILDSKLKNELKGFVWFRDAASNFPTTEPSVIAMFTGELYDISGGGLNVMEFADKVSEGSIGNQFQAQRGMVRYTSGAPVGDKLFPKDSLVKFARIDPKHLTAYSDLMNYSLFRAVPDMLKQTIYRNGMWRVHLNYNKEAGKLGHSFKQLNYISDSEFIAADIPSTFKFHHSFVTHSPTIFGANCEFIGKAPSTLENKKTEGICAMNKVLKIIKKLKRANVFDNTMIIVLADHGSDYRLPIFKSGIPYGRAAPTLLIKPLYSKKTFQISEYPAQLSDISKTIAKAFNISKKYPGVDLLSSNKPNRKTRLFNNYYWARADWGTGWTKSRLPEVTKYTVRGSLREPMNWKKLAKPILPMECGGKINFTQKDHSRYYNAWGLSGYESVGRWSDGQEVKIDFKVKPDCGSQSITFNLRGFVTDKNSEQTASVFIDDQFAGDLRFSLSDGYKPKTFTFALPKSESNSYSLRFKFDKPRSPESLGLNKDPRNLGFLFVGMKLISKDAKVQ